MAIIQMRRLQFNRMINRLTVCYFVSIKFCIDIRDLTSAKLNKSSNVLNVLLADGRWMSTVLA